MVTAISGRMRYRSKGIFRSSLGGKMDRTTDGLIHGAAIETYTNTYKIASGNLLHDSGNSKQNSVTT